MAKPQEPAIDSTPGQDLSLLMVGADHHTAPLELREQVAYSSEAAQELLDRLLARSEISEACVLSTCNRTEVYIQPEEQEPAYRAAVEMVFLERAPQIEQEGRLYVKRDEEAARQLLAVASGLESMILGEPEILGQVKQAAALAESAGSTSTVLRKLLHTAATAGKRARAETAISTGAVSLGYAVVELARNIFSRLEDCRVLLLGAGEIGSQVARDLLDKGTQVKVATRSPERARRFRQEFPGAQPIPFEQRFEALDGVDVLVASTAAQEPVVGKAPVAEAMKRRQPGRSLLVVDLGVPRNVDPGVRRVDNVFLHDLDSLQTLIDRNLKRRREEIPQVQEVVDQELARFRTWYRGLAVEPIIAQLQKQAEQIRRQELATTLNRFPQETHDQLERLTRSMVRKILHHPSSHLRNAVPDHHRSKLELVRQLFQLDEGEE
jgi:glutamyl-tRNA reductase